MPSTGQPCVVVSCGSSKVGRDIAIDQAGLGREVLAVGRRPEDLRGIGSLDSVMGGGIVRVVADPSTDDGVATILAAVGARPVEAVVAASGAPTPPYGPGCDVSEGALKTALHVNLFSAVLLIEALLPRMIDRQGRVVLVASTAALNGAAGPYGIANAALAAYGRELAARAGGRGITANTIAAGLVATEEAFSTGGSGETLDAAVARTLVGRIGAPRDITACARWLLGSEAGWVTGQTVSVDGGTKLLR